MPKLTKRFIDAASPHKGRDKRIWDTDPRGFHLRIKPSGVKTFFVQYRSPEDHKKRRIHIGQYGRLAVDEARIQARKFLAAVDRGEDPLLIRKRQRDLAHSTALTLTDFCDVYLQDAKLGLVTYRGRPKKASTLSIDAGHVRRHIKPLLGKRLVREVTTEDITNFMHAVRLGKTATTEKTGPRGLARVTGGATTAKRTVALLGSIFSYAVKKNLRHDNPVTAVEMPPTRKRERYLDPNEYGRLGQALEKLKTSGANPVALRSIYALALTGCRRNEIFRLKHAEIDTHRQCLNLSDTKTGQQLRPISTAALNILTAAPRNDSSPYVFPAARGNGYLTDVKVFRKALNIAGLSDVTLHTLRHSFSSVALELEYSDLSIAGLIGHRSHSVTSRYTHHVDSALVAAANRVSSVIAERMGVASIGE